MTALYSESNGRLLLEVRPDNVAPLKEMLKGLPLTEVGEVASDERFEIAVNGIATVMSNVPALVEAWKTQPDE